MTKLYLGKLTDGERIWLEKHRWDCGWYWAFGYIGNRNFHAHIDSLITYRDRFHGDWTNVETHFSETWMTQSDWWIVRDMFISAYALKKAADALQHGGHQTDKAKPYRVLDSELAKEINAKLEMVLDNGWNYLIEAAARKS